MYPYILNLLIYITVSALLLVSVLHARTKAIGEYIVTVVLNFPLLMRVSLTYLVLYNP